MNFETVIIGAGLSGLAAARTLEEHGRRNYIILEKGKNAGGRVQTIEVDGYRLDLGFQVGLSSYPAFRNVLPLRELQPCYFGSGALVEETEGALNLLAHPLIHPGKLGNALASKLSIADKFRLVSLVTSCLLQSDRECLKPTGLTALQYLKKRGFTDHIIDIFFQPFFGSIFLDSQLRTDAALFRYYLKRFATGRAFLPAGGVSGMSEAMLKHIDKDKIHYNSEVEKITTSDQGVEIQISGSQATINAEKLILAADPATTSRLMDWPAPEFRPTKAIYFSSNVSLYDGPWIVLPSKKDQLARHFIQITNIDASLAPRGKELINATVLDDREMSEPELADKVAEEIKRLFPETGSDLKFLKTVSVPQALPSQSPESLSNLPTLTLPEGIYLAGDLVSNASLQNALQSGRTAARAVMNRL